MFSGVLMLMMEEQNMHVTKHNVTNQQWHYLIVSWAELNSSRLHKETIMQQHHSSC